MYCCSGAGFQFREIVKVNGHINSNNKIINLNSSGKREFLDCGLEFLYFQCFSIKRSK